MNNIALTLKKLKISTLDQNCCNFSLIKISLNWRFPRHFELNFSKIDMAPFRPKTIIMLVHNKLKFAAQVNMVIVFGRNGAMSIFEKFSSKCPGKRQFAEIFINEKLQQF